MGGRSERVAATTRGRLAGGGRLRRLGPSRRERRFANLLNSVSILYEAREQNVFGGTESGYTALCGDKDESTAMTNTLDANGVQGGPAQGVQGAPRRRAAQREIVLVSPRHGGGSLFRHAVSGAAQAEEGGDNRGQVGSDRQLRRLENGAASP